MNSSTQNLDLDLSFPFLFSTAAFPSFLEVVCWFGLFGFCFCLVVGHSVFCIFTCFPTVRDQLTDQCHELDQHSVQKNRFVTSTWSSEVQLFVESEERSLSESESETWHLYLSNSDV